MLRRNLIVRINIGMHKKNIRICCFPYHKPNLIAITPQNFNNCQNYSGKHSMDTMNRCESNNEISFLTKFLIRFAAFTIFTLIIFLFVFVAAWIFHFIGFEEPVASVLVIMLTCAFIFALG